MSRPDSAWSSAWTAAAAYGALAVAITWPLARIMGRTVGRDFGDPLFNCWALAWTSRHVLQFLHGHVSALADYWNGNIFYPTRTTLAFSEHLTPEMLQGLPVFAATGSILATYNVILLGTIVLSGLGMFLLVRELTGRPLAAFVAGAAFACAPYRIDQFSHIEVLSSQWMPFALYGFRRYFATTRWRPLIGGAVALAAQALSCGYYLAYFPPFVAAYCLFEIGARRRWRSGRTWLQLSAAAALTLAIVGPFVAVYFHVRHTTDLGVRPLAAIHEFSADTRAYATAPSDSALWGARLAVLPRPEGFGFQGFATMALAATAIVAAIVPLWRRRDRASRAGAWRQFLTGAVATLTVMLMAVLAALLVGGRLIWTRLDGTRVFMNGNAAVLFGCVIAGIAVLALLSSRVRGVLRGTTGSTVAFWAWAALAAAWMSLGPDMTANGWPIGPGLYRVFYSLVPGFNGLRVPSLCFMLVSCFLSILAGLALARLPARRRGLGTTVAALALAAIFAEGCMDDVFPRSPVPLDRLDPAYVAVAALPAGTVLAELPFGTSDDPVEIQYTYFAGWHGKPILNGYSGFFPDSFLRLSQAFAGPPTDATWAALASSGATHVIVHEPLFTDGAGPIWSNWLRSHGAAEILAVGRTRLFQLRNYTGG